MKIEQFESSVPPFAPVSNAVPADQAPLYNPTLHAHATVPPGQFPAGQFYVPHAAPASETVFPSSVSQAQQAQQGQQTQQGQQQPLYPELYAQPQGNPQPGGSAPTAPHFTPPSESAAKGPQFFQASGAVDQDVATVKKQLLQCYRNEMTKIKQRYLHLNKKIDAAETALINAMISTSPADINTFVQKAASIDQHLKQCEKYQPWAIAGYCVAASVMLGALVPLVFTLSWMTVAIAVIGFAVGSSTAGIIAGTDSFRYSFYEANRYQKAHKDVDDFLQPYTQVSDPAFLAPPNTAAPCAPPQYEAGVEDLPPPPTYAQAVGLK